MKIGMAIVLLSSVMMGMSACLSIDREADSATSDSVADRTPDPTAREVLDKHLDAVGGAEKIRNVESLIFEVASGSALLPPGEEAVLYLKKPDDLLASRHQVGADR